MQLPAQLVLPADFGDQILNVADVQIDSPTRVYISGWFLTRLHQLPEEDGADVRLVDAQGFIEVHGSFEYLAP